MATRQAGGTHILARRIDGPEYQTYCGHVVDGFMADPWIKTRWPSAIPLHKEEIRKGCVGVKGVDKTCQRGGAKVYHQRGHWPA